MNKLNNEMENEVNVIDHALFVNLHNYFGLHNLYESCENVELYKKYMNLAKTYGKEIYKMNEYTHTGFDKLAYRYVKNGIVEDKDLALLEQLEKYFTTDIDLQNKANRNDFKKLVSYFITKELHANKNQMPTSYSGTSHQVLTLLSENKALGDYHRIPDILYHGVKFITSENPKWSDACHCKYKVDNEKFLALLEMIADATKENAKNKEFVCYRTKEWECLTYPKLSGLNYHLNSDYFYPESSDGTITAKRSNIEGEQRSELNTNPYSSMIIYSDDTNTLNRMKYLINEIITNAQSFTRGNEKNDCYNEDDAHDMRGLIEG